MLSTESTGKKIILRHDNVIVFTHQKHKPALYLLVERNGKLKKQPIKDLRVFSSGQEGCSFACSEPIVLTVTERGQVLDFSFSAQNLAIKAVIVRLFIPGKTPLWGQTSRTERLVILTRSGTLNAKGSYVYSPWGFALGSRAREAMLRKQGPHVAVTGSMSGFVIAFSTDSRQSASAVHMEIARHGTDPFPSDGVYIRAGGGEIAVSCKVQSILDEHIPVHGLLIDDLFEGGAQAGLPWKDSYPALATDSGCYAGAGISPCVLITPGTDANDTVISRNQERRFSAEILRQLKTSGIAHLGMIPSQSGTAYAYRNFFAYIASQAKLAGLSLAFSGIGPQSDIQTWALERMGGNLDSEAFVRSVLSASYGAFGCHVAEIPLDLRAWKEGTDFTHALELAIFSPLLVLHAGSSSERDIPFLQSGKARVLHELIHVYSALKPYHEHCREQFVKKRMPVHSLPRYDRASAFKNYRAFMYGDDILCTVRQKQNSPKAECLLPEGEWIHFWTGLRYDGGRIVVTAEAGYPAVFYQSGSAFSDLFDSVRRTRQR